MLGSLKGRAWTATEHLPLEGASGLATENGLELLLAALKEAFKETESSEMAENFENFFFRTRRESGEDMISYQQKFMAAYRKIEGMTIPGSAGAAGTAITIPDTVLAYSYCAGRA